MHSRAKYFLPFSGVQMALVFISYAREDKGIAERLAKELEKKGWDVWWDPRLRPGQTFRTIIQQQLDTADCIIVLWSKNSIQSGFVIDEATEGLNRQILAPAKIEKNVKAPLGFRSLQTADLSDWRGNPHAELNTLLGAVAELLHDTIKPSAMPQPRVTEGVKNSWRDRISSIFAAPDEGLWPERSPVRGEDASTYATRTGGIYVSYRRSDTAYPAAWLYDRLVGHFGPDRVFKDVDSIEIGQNFPEVIANSVASCDVLLALIGNQWLTATDESGRRRIEDPNDFLRLEIEAALVRSVLLIPVLVDGAPMPRVEELPASLAGLARRQALRISPTRFEFDIGQLLDQLDRILAEK